jgi:ferredoxin-type protein NapH
MNTLRWLIQSLAALLTNAYWLFPFGEVPIYRGPMKAVCTPGLNCYACPAAVVSCPVGTFQHFMANLRFGVAAGAIPQAGLSVLGYLGFIGILVGRMPCGWVCPFGFIQDLLNKIPTRKFSLWPPLNWVKYGVLAVLVVALPLLLLDETGLGQPWFCKLICPAGTLEGALPILILKPNLWQTLGFYFWNKITIMSLIIVWAVLTSRPFCRTLCPLGAFYSLFNRISLFQLSFDEQHCVACQACARQCPMGLEAYAEANDTNCIRCLKCVEACKFGALSYKRRRPAPEMPQVSSLPT